MLANPIPVPLAPFTHPALPTTYQSFILQSTQAYKNQLSELASLFDLAKFQSSVSKDLTIEQKNDLFQWAYSNQYPPSLKSIPDADQKSLFQIFNLVALIETLGILLPPILIPKVIRDLAPDALKDKTMQSLVDRNRQLHSGSQNMYFNKNIGDRDDWYTDAVYAQQRFVGTNPTNIAVASSQWVQKFKAVAEAQHRADILQVIASSTPDSLLVEDYSFFRSAVGAPANSNITSADRHTGASVTLFHLEPQGKLHPLAITLDYKGSMEASVTTLNRRVSSQSAIPESGDWPWRYAKMCTQVADWTWHEIAVHLVHTHLVEEVTIIAAHRAFDPLHVVFKLLEDHWNVTLSLNKAARDTLMPKVITQIAGFTPDQTYALCNYSYNSFDWTGSYVPNDLRRRGFPVEDLDKPKYHNYGYARNISRMWDILRKFVATVLRKSYKNDDKQVAQDKYVQAFCSEMRTGGKLSKFPDVKTLDELIDMVTMCIHIASPQHTAVNYLQQYYQTFVPNKPSALYAPLPKTLKELEAITEADVLKALPVRVPVQWLLQAQLPYLLSFQVSEDQTILRYAVDAQWRFAGDPSIRDAAKVLKSDLDNFVHVVEKLSKELDDQKTQYLVLDPRETASSILI